MTQEADQFAERLASSSPTARDLLTEHLADNEGLLVHVYLFDLLGWISRASALGPAHVPMDVYALIDAVDSSYHQLGPFVDNAIEATFLEAFGYDALPEFLLTPGLLGELDRLRSSGAL